LSTPSGRDKVAEFFPRIEQDNKLSFDNIDPQDYCRGVIPQGLNKASAF